MIYFLAPFNLTVNTTSRNRILSFHRAFQEHGIDATLINPPLIARDREVYLNGIIQTEANDLGNVIDIPLSESVEERIVSLLVKKPSYKAVSAIFNLIYLTTAGRDFNYPLHSINEYFKNIKLRSQDIIIASSPPATLSIAARVIAKRYSCKLILDYRDPWTYGYKPIDSMPFINDFKKYRSRTLENKCLDYASLINCDSESVKQLN